MNTLKLTGLLVGPLALAATLAGSASAQTTTCPPGSQQFTQTFVDNFGPEIGSWPQSTLVVPKFSPPANATLIRAQLSFCGRVTATLTYTNNDDDPATFSYTVTVNALGVAADPTSPISNFPLQASTGIPPTTLGPFEGGETNLDTGVICAPNSPQIFRSSTALAWFIAQPGNDQVRINHTGTTSSTANQPADFNLTTASQTRLTLTVEYVYCVQQDTTPPDGGCACHGPSPHYRRPGSLLLFPEFDNRQGDITVLTVTNTACTITTPNVNIEYKYIDKTNCSEFNRSATLTACDTLTVLTNVHNPQQEQGYVYVFAKDNLGRPIVWNHLIGNLLVISGLEAFDYSVNPVAFRGIGSGTGIAQPDGTLTDLDGDANLDLDGYEYEQAPDTITIPRFLGQDNPGKGGDGLVRSQLILIALSGGSQFSTTIDCLLYNDNEEAFSFEHTFYCWEKPYLRDLSFAFNNNFLKTTNHDPNEILGAPQRESGWICCDGAFASSTQESIEDPAFYMVLVERVGGFGVADLPFECGTQRNGALLPRSLFGDGDPTPVDGDNQ